MKSADEIIVRLPNWIGDAVLSTGALSELRRGLPEARITLIILPWAAPLFKESSLCNRVMVYDRRHGLGRIIPFMKAAAEIRRCSYDVAVLFQNAFEAALLVRTAGVPRRIGYPTDGRRILLTDVVEQREIEGRHEVHYYMPLIRRLANRPGGNPRPELQVSEESLQSALHKLNAAGLSRGEEFISMHPGAAYGPAKRWPLDRFAALADRIYDEMGIRTVYFGGKDEEGSAKSLKGMIKSPAILMTGMLPLDETMAAISRARLFIGNDSGIMHIASALSVPTAAIFGPTDPEATGPLTEHRRIIRKNNCKPLCRLRECDIDHRCMRAVSVDEVWEVFIDLYEETASLFKKRKD